MQAIKGERWCLPRLAQLMSLSPAETSLAFLGVPGIWPQHQDVSVMMLSGEGRAEAEALQGASGICEQHSVNPRNLYILLRPFSSWIINRGLVQRQTAF